MDKHTFIGKRRLGTTDLADFTDYQGVGQDPLYKRYATVQNVVKREIPEAYESFFAIPDYVNRDDIINWYIPEWRQVPQRLVDLQGPERLRYENIKKKTLDIYRDSLNRLSGEDLRIMAGALRYISDDFIYCADGKVYVLAWGMAPDKTRHISTGLLVHDAPEVIPDPEPDTEEVAQPESPATPETEPPVVPPAPAEENHPMYECVFHADPHGVATGSAVIMKTPGSFITPEEVPGVAPDKGFKFIGWEPVPGAQPVESNMDFYAAYEEKLPWYKRFWAWIKSLGWLKWLLLALLIAAATFLVLWLLSQCSSCHREYNGVKSPDREVIAPGDTIDDFGKAKPIELNDGKLPNKDFIAPPVRNEDGTVPEIIREEGVPPVMSNRLILFMEDENGDLDGLADSFKKVYPGSQYQIIGFDKEVKSLVIQIPENERNSIRESLPSKLPQYNFIVFDEEIYELNQTQSESTSNAAPGWHLKAVKAPEGWNITKGSPDVTVAVVDDGIDASHPMFKGRIKDAYNVYTQNNQLGYGAGHGTHTAALAVGSLEYLDRGAAGIAPDCSLMPVQVFDNDICPLSALISGIMYSIHKGADVINVSVAPQFPGLSLLPPTMQNEIGQTRFKNIEKLWSRVSKIAAKKRSIVVYAAGNDDILSIIPPENRSDFAITVGAVDERLYPTEFTNYGVCTDISAPGTGIYSAFPNNQIKQFDGTSMAAPIVTGTVALMKTLKRDLTVAEARNALYKSGIDVYGYMPPMVQVNLALQAVKNGDLGTPEPRSYRPVPEADQGSLRSDPPSSWVDFGPFSRRSPDGTVIIQYPDGDGTISNGGELPWEVIENSGSIPGVPGDGSINDGNGSLTSPEGSNGNLSDPNDSNSNHGYGNDDTEEIKKMIQYHKDKIKELEQKLNRNNR